MKEAYATFGYAWGDAIVITLMILIFTIVVLGTLAVKIAYDRAKARKRKTEREHMKSGAYAR